MTFISYRPVAVVLAKDHEGGAAMSGLCFAPTPETARQLARQRMVFRPFPGGFRLAAAHDLASGGGPMVPFSDVLSLLFAITLDEAAAARLRGSEAARKSGPNLFLSNRNAGGTPQGGPALSRDEKVGLKDRAWIVPRRHLARIALGTGNRPSRIELRSYFGGAIGDAIPIDAPAQAESATMTIALEGQEGVAFLLRPKPQGEDRLIIADDELADMRADGALELVLKSFPGPDPAGGRPFTATFER